jgi:CBS domain-containing protein
VKIRAVEIMTSPVITVGPEERISDVMDILAANNISGVPVVDDNEKVIGIVCEADIVKFSSRTHVIPLIRGSKWLSPYTEIGDIASFRKGFEVLKHSQVKDVMLSRVITAQEDTSGGEIARMMTRRNVNRVPVVDAEGKIKGIITRSNLVKYLATR